MSYFTCLSKSNIVCTVVLLVCFSNSLPLKIKLNVDQSFCFTEDIPRHSLVKLQASNNDWNFMTQITFGKTLLYNKTTAQNLTYSFTTQNYGLHRICLTNISPGVSKMMFDFLIGKKANDHTSAEQHESFLTDIMQQSKIADLYLHQIEEQNKEGLEMLMADKLKPSIGMSIDLFFSTIFIGAILLLTYFQYKTVREHLINRKYI